MSYLIPFVVLASLNYILLRFLSYTYSYRYVLLFELLMSYLIEFFVHIHSFLLSFLSYMYYYRIVCRELCYVLLSGILMSYLIHFFSNPSYSPEFLSYMYLYYYRNCPQGAVLCPTVRNTDVLPYPVRCPGPSYSPQLCSTQVKNSGSVS